MMSMDQRKLHGVQALHLGLAEALTDGPHTLEEIQAHYNAHFRWLGMFAWQLQNTFGEQAFLKDGLLQALSEMEVKGWVQAEGDRYRLTSLGKAEVDHVLHELSQARKYASRLLKPQTASIVSLMVYLVLALIKLPAGLLSGSVGLVNDAFDTLGDGVCSLLVVLGFRFHKEGYVNVVQVVAILVAGVVALYQALSGLFKPYQPDVDGFTFAAAILSSLACAGLYFYQRYVGVRSSSFGLVTQSVDSRNHVIVGASVTAGLLAALLHYPLLDSLVGLGVAVLILKSAIEMGGELFHSLKDPEALNFSNYRLSFRTWQRYQREQLCNWILFLIRQGIAKDRDQLESQARQAMQLDDNPILRLLIFDQYTDVEQRIDLSLQEAVAVGWITMEVPFELTATGEKHLEYQLRSAQRKLQRHMMPALSASRIS